MVHVLKGRPMVRVDVDGTRTEYQADPLAFATAIGVMRWVVNTGRYRRGIRPATPKGVSELERVSLYDVELRDYIMSHETRVAITAALRRFSGLLHYLREVEPEWTPVPGSAIHWADNSAEHTEINKYGATRRVMDAPPSGDVCF